jgi:hypothetical protein
MNHWVKVAASRRAKLHFSTTKSIARSMAGAIDDEDLHIMNGQ